MTVWSASHEPDVTLNGNLPAWLSLPLPSECSITSVSVADTGFKYSNVSRVNRCVEVLLNLQRSRGRTGSVTSYSSWMADPAAPMCSIGPALEPLWHVARGGGVGWGAVLGLGDGLAAGVAIAALGEGEGEIAAVGEAAPQAG